MKATIQAIIGWLDRAITWVMEKNMQLRFKSEAARVKVTLGTDAPDSARTNKHYVTMELDFMSKWAGKVPDVDIAMTLGRPTAGVKKKIQRIE